MSDMKASRNLERGGISVTQVVMFAILAVVLYMAYAYVPGMMHKGAMRDIARNAAAHMVVEASDPIIREEVVKKATEAGIVVGQSDVRIDRQLKPSIKYTVTITWTEKVKHIWGKTEVYKSTASGIAEPGKSGVKNAT